MRLAVFADIHGNLEALQAVMLDWKEQRIDRYICLGDVVGYGANPNECVEFVRSLPNNITLLGNHDAAATWGETPYGMSQGAQRAIFWTMEKLTTENSEFLKSLQPVREMGEMVFCHANPYNPKAWRYVNGKKYAARSFAGTAKRLIFVGHTHKPLIVTRKNIFNIVFEYPGEPYVYAVGGLNRYIYNCGSVGQPRNGKPHACYLIYDTREQLLSFQRVEYDTQKAAAKIIEAGLPAHLARRLIAGI
ncbi:MAG: metallophosphoesterase [Desulfobulbaceae bacterium]|nr:metallophosphoesterase [Desulfobulbaceae bacterium]